MTSGWLLLGYVQMMLKLWSLLQNQASILVKAAVVFWLSDKYFSRLKENNTTLKNLEQESDQLTH